MMRQCLFYTSEDPYSYDMRLNSQKFYRDGSNVLESESTAYLEHYKARFKQKEWSALLVVIIDTDTNTGAMTIVRNEMMQHPLKKKLIINEQVLEARKARPQVVKKSAFLNNATIMPDWDYLIQTEET